MNNENFENAQDALEYSWEVHRQAFGPILEPAFAENPQIRIPLIAALNHISRREVTRGLEILQSIKEHCIYDDDKAAWLFCVGLCFEMAGKTEKMLQWYEAAGKYGHHFYLPYLKIAKAAHQAAQFEKALKYDTIAISCLLEMREEEMDETILGSAYTNLASCLTMLYRYAEAEQAWHTAQQYPQPPGAAATGAILYAAMGNAEKCEAYIETLTKNSPAWVAQTQTMTQQILSGTHPHFRNERGK